MAKGEACLPPTCKICSEAHRLEPGKVCPKFRRVVQPVPKQLPPPPKKKDKK